VSLVLGVDPGLTGALALIEKRSKAPVKVWDMPITPERDLDAEALAAELDAWSINLSFAVVEEVSAMKYTALDERGRKFVRGQGAAASFAFGRYAGIIRGILAAYTVPVYLVRPSVWKLSMGLSRDKADSLTMARSRFPSWSAEFRLKKHDGRAEAALLALFGAEKFK
jgi:crossover junction endodeoxyribonuclease RuvC